MTVVIGLTGSIASGKSTIARQFIAYGIPVIDADLIARQVVEIGEPAYEKVVHTFGESILEEDGSINRQALGKLIFNDKEKRQALNEIVHPAVRKEMLRQRDEHVTKGTAAVVLDIPLLFESKLTHFVEKILVVSVRPDVQMDRLMKRNTLSKEEAESRIASQIPVQEKETLADAVIDNNGTKEHSYDQLEALLSTWDIPIATEKPSTE
ncbi:MAG TPA: dephospho-CoA kinase [Bacillota bacterium]|nr:dephospho-CoA kinase [Bacillota bacterium]